MMVTLAILGLLIALAIPNYRRHLIVRHVDDSFRTIANLLKLAASTARTQGGDVQVVLSNTTTQGGVVELLMTDTSSGTAKVLKDYISDNDVQMSWADGGAPLGATGSTSNLTINYWGSGAADDGSGHVVNPGVLAGVTGAAPLIRIQILSTNTTMEIQTHEADIQIGSGQVVMLGI